MGSEFEADIKIKMFGFFDITYKGKSIFLETSNSIKSIAILRFLLAQKNKLFLSETIAENVWPENEYLDEKKVIRTYIHRLRKILSQDNAFKKDFSEQISVLNVKGSYKIVTAPGVEMDTEVFEALKKSLEKESAAQSIMDRLNGINELYKGEFLEDCHYDHWVLMFRNYYLRLFCAIVNGALEKLEQNKAYNEIIQVCENSLKVYDLDETMNIYFIRAMLETNQATNALQHYNLITSKMYNELSVMPSEKMRHVYARIKSKGGEPPRGGAGLEGLDNQSLMLMINEAVKQQLAPDKNKNSVGYIRVSSNSLVESAGDADDEPKSPADKKALVAASLKQAIEYALRKNDYYVITDEPAALLVLTDASEESYPAISNRICQSFYSRHNGFETRLNIKIYPAVKVL